MSSAGVSPTSSPTLLLGIGRGRRAPVLVTGATGTLGREVVRELQRSHVPVRALVRRHAPMPDVEQVEGDLVSGVGLADAVDRVAAVINCATDPDNFEAVDVAGTARLATLAAAADARLVHVSIVGCWDTPLPYHRAKAAAESSALGGGGHAVIARATQFHPFVADLLRPRRGMTIAPAGARIAPCDPGWVAARLVDLAMDPQLPNAPVEFAGPEILQARDVAVLIAHARGLPLRRHLGVPPVGGIARALARGSILPGPDAVRGGCTFADWLGRTPEV